MPPNSGKEKEDVWKGALRQAENILGDEDWEAISQFQSETELLAEVKRLERTWADNPINSLLRGLKPHISHLQLLVAFLAGSFGVESITSACLLGLIGLMLQLAGRIQAEKALKEISTFLGHFGNKLELFEVYRTDLDLGSDTDMLDRFFDILVELQVTCATVIRHFRKQANNPLEVRYWSAIESRLNETLQNLTNEVDHLNEIVNARRSVASGNTQNESASNRPRPVDLPCRTLPYARNSAFFGRDETLLEMRDALEPDSTKCSVRSVALWGCAGIGKSQTALEYAHRQMEEGREVIIWIPSETEPEITAAWMAAARQLKPPGFDEATAPERTCDLMRNWLQTTTTPWLLLFDNVEDNDLLLRNWPTAGNGQIVVTCRSEHLAHSPAAEKFEIESFQGKESGQLLLKLAKKRNPNEAEIEAAEELAGLLGGLALALDVTARQILEKKKTVRRFLDYYKDKENHPALRRPPIRIRNLAYPRNLDTLWHAAFMNISEDAGRILSLTCFYAPDNIPRELWSRKIFHTESWRFLEQKLAIEDAETELVHNALVRINEEAETIGVHRLIQDAYYEWMDSTVREDAYRVACSLLCDAFPKREHGRQLYQGWNVCAGLIPHVVSTQDRYAELTAQGLDMQSEAYWTLLADAAWFCSETCTLDLGHRIGRTAADACRDKDSLAFAYLCESVATVDHRRGRYASAYDFFQKALEIRLRDSSTHPRVLADSYSAVGLALFGLFRSEDAIKAVDQAMALVHSAPQDEQETYNVDRYLRNRSRPKIALGRYEEAREDVAYAERFQTSVYHEDSHFHGETAYVLGKLASIEGDQVLAMKCLQRSYDLQSPGKPMHQSVASTLYHMALVTLKSSGNETVANEQAAVYLNHALRITRHNEPMRGDQGESARVMWRLSQVLTRQGHTEDAVKYATLATEIKTGLEKTGLHPKAPDEEQSWDCFSDLVDR